jgi:hypothetical protein
MAEAPPGHLSADQFLLRTPAVAGRPTDMADLLTVRSAGHPQFEVTAQPMGPGPGPDGDGQAADTSSAQRPTMRLAAGHGQPRGLHVLARSSAVGGGDRRGGGVHD